jgi:methylase of polypeptide subunit release factors
MKEQISYNDYLEATNDMLNASQQEGLDHTIPFKGKSLTIQKNVFSPKYFHDSRFFANKLPITKGQSFLEIGPGCGIVSIAAALRGASRVLAIDSNLDAVWNTRENAKTYEVADKIEVRHGVVYTLYGEIEIEEQFDSIFWNVPFGYLPKGYKVSRLQKAVFDPGYKHIREFIEGAPDHLKAEGKLHIGFSSTLGIPELLENRLTRTGFEHRIIARTKSREKYPVSFELYEAKVRE